MDKPESQTNELREETGDTLFVSPGMYHDGWGWWGVPCVKASDPNYVKHVHCEGARFHVLSWDNLHGEKCSTPDCIKNKHHLSPDVTNKSVISVSGEAPNDSAQRPNEGKEKEVQVSAQPQPEEK